MGNITANGFHGRFLSACKSTEDTFSCQGNWRDRYVTYVQVRQNGFKSDYHNCAELGPLCVPKMNCDYDVKIESPAGQPDGHSNGVKILKNGEFACKTINNYGARCSFECSPSSSPSALPTLDPTFFPSGIPTLYPTDQPTFAPTISPTTSPSFQPTVQSQTRFSFNGDGEGLTNPIIGIASVALVFLCALGLKRPVSSLVQSVNNRINYKPVPPDEGHSIDDHYSDNGGIELANNLI